MQRDDLAKVYEVAREVARQEIALYVANKSEKLLGGVDVGQKKAVEDIDEKLLPRKTKKK